MRVKVLQIVQSRPLYMNENLFSHPITYLRFKEVKNLNSLILNECSHDESTEFYEIDNLGT